jgi:tetratricopeptide (TPR) repeat protein
MSWFHLRIGGREAQRMMGACRGLVSAALGALLVGLALPARAADAPGCLASETRTAVACGGTPRLSHAAAEPAAVAFDVPAPKPATRPDALPAPDAAGDGGRPDRPLNERSRSLLLRSIDQLTRLYEITPVESRDRPRLLRRLGDDYAELAADLARDHHDLAALAKDVRELNPPRSKMLSEKAAALDARVRRARLKAVGYYRRLADEHPGFCLFPRRKVRALRACNDEVLYWLGYELEQLGQPDRALESYRALVAAHSRSHLATHAYLALAELHFAARQPARWAPARAAYEKVLEKKPGHNPLWGYASYKLGHVQWIQGEHARALDSFVRAIEFALRFPASPNAAALARAARRDLVPVYARVGDPSKAWSFFEAQSGGDPAATLAMMEALGRSLVDTSSHELAGTVFAELVRRGPPERGCSYRVGLARSTIALDPTDRGAALTVLADMLGSYVAMRAGAEPPDAKLRCGNAAAELLTETAMAWYVESVGPPGSAGTGDAATGDAAATALRLLVDNFSAAELAEFDFPRFAKEQWPTPARLHYAFGMLERARGRALACARELDAAYETEPDGPLAADAVLGAALCWIEAQRGGLAKLPAARELDEGERSMARALDRALCVLEVPRREGWPIAAVKLGRARLHLVEGQYEPAAAALREVALGEPGGASLEAARLYLWSLDALAAQQGSLACPDRAADDIEALTDRHCVRGRRDARSFCEDVARRRRVKGWLARG